MSKITHQINRGLAHEIVKQIDNFLFDCDGVLWHGAQVIPGTAEAVQKLKKLGKRIFYLTNNSSKTRAQIVEKCHKLGFPAELDNIVGTAHASALYLKTMGFSGKVYMVGNASMAAEMDNLGIKYTGLGPDHVPDDYEKLDDIVKFQSDWKPDPEVNCVLVGFDPHHSYMKMMKAATYAKNRNNLFLATNEDPFLPTKLDICIPGTGSIVSSIKIPTRREPHVIGKPETAFFDLLHEVHGLEAGSTLMVGDSLNTDIHMAVNCDIKSVLVLTGADGLQQVEERQHSDDPVKRKVVPDYYIDSFGHFGQLIGDLPEVQCSK
ncbi:glycerol-3-phosphate phosphatase-like isoform X2 [Mercenaria mercenaria]|uniref:glycerol-3-phosphate phosphatase-like isoform X2 n=1 Tax=Mercenaria mercenaria TaxID=6596 RepID=UPI00234FA858|nr:glycerol-3-phosphate phosphatase-like isoform X2 [Mercenaria mercenaria]